MASGHVVEKDSKRKETAVGQNVMHSPIVWREYLLTCRTLGVHLVVTTLP